LVAISACLIGCKCRYNGCSRPQAGALKLLAAGRALPLCPEQLGGLSTPRPPVELSGGDGNAVLAGCARALTADGTDLTKALVQGAWETLRVVELGRLRVAVLKEGSPSCGVSRIGDGSFRGQARPGRGVTAALLARHGIEVYSEDQLDSLLCRYGLE
jgi:uncharacterized protein YbbK (DUF523 family)